MFRVGVKVGVAATRFELRVGTLDARVRVEVFRVGVKVGVAVTGFELGSALCVRVGVIDGERG